MRSISDLDTYIGSSWKAILVLGVSFLALHNATIMVFGYISCFLPRSDVVRPLTKFASQIMCPNLDTDKFPYGTTIPAMKAAHSKRLERALKKITFTLLIPNLVLLLPMLVSIVYCGKAYKVFEGLGFELLPEEEEEKHRMKVNFVVMPAVSVGAWLFDCGLAYIYYVHCHQFSYLLH